MMNRRGCSQSKIDTIMSQRPTPTLTSFDGELMPKFPSRPFDEDLAGDAVLIAPVSTQNPC